MKARHVPPLFLAAFALAAHGGEKAIKNGDTLVFMGDSITQFGKDTVDGYLRLVVQGLAANNINVTWYGVGISGQTAVQMKNRFQNDVVAKNPDVCTIFAGVNDCGSNWPVNTNSTPNDVAAMADMAIAAGILPSGERPDDAKRLRDARVNERIRLLADGRNVLWCDFGPKLLEPDGTLAKETAHDFVHLTEKGYEIWTAALLPYLDCCLGFSGEPP